MKTYIKKQVFLAMIFLSLNWSSFSFAALRDYATPGASLTARSENGFLGEEKFDFVGDTITSAGDVDGDGISDILIGSRYAANSSGKTYLILGRSIPRGANLNLSFADTTFLGEHASAIPDPILTADYGDSSGVSVASGDFDRDGLSDILIGAWNNDDGGTNAGKVYLILGRTILGSSGTIPIASADLAFIGEHENDRAGNAIANAGDINGDGFSDILISAYGCSETGEEAGKIYLISGAKIYKTLLSGRRTLRLSEATYFFTGEHARDHSGQKVSSAGDMDGDGLSDILISAPLNGDAGIGAGKTYLFLGRTFRSFPEGTTFSLSGADYAFTGEGRGHASGCSIACAGDINGDGLSDILISAPENNEGGYQAGKIYLILGSSLRLLRSSVVSLGVADISFLGDTDGLSGWVVASAGDVDGDGLSDILIGAPSSGLFALSGSYLGKAYLILGRSLGAWGIGARVSLSRSSNYIFTEDIFDQCGFAVSSAGDIDRDGFSDIMIGAQLNSQSQYKAGKVYLIRTRD